MRLETIHEGKAIVLSKEAYDLAARAAAIAFRGYEYWHKRVSTEVVDTDAIEQDYNEIKDNLVMHPRLRPESTDIIIGISYNVGMRQDAAYYPDSPGVVNIQVEIGIGNPKLAQPYIREMIIHEMTHAVDPKVAKETPKSRVEFDMQKIKGGTRDEQEKEWHKYARQPVEVEARFAQLASRFMRLFAGVPKAQVLDKIRHLTPDEFMRLYKGHSYEWATKIIANNKAYWRKFINTLYYMANLQEGTSTQRRLTEADLSRRQFLKLGGQAAMAAAAPQTALKGLMGGTTKAAQPLTQEAMKAWLLKWIKDNGLEKKWLNIANEHASLVWDHRIHPDPEMAKSEYEIMIRHYMDAYRDGILRLAGDYKLYAMSGAGNELDVLANLLMNFNSDNIPGLMDKELPKEVTQYWLSVWGGKPVSINNPLVANREEWSERISRAVWDIPQDASEYVPMLSELTNILKSTVSPAKFAKIQADTSKLLSAIADKIETHRKYLNRQSEPMDADEREEYENLTDKQEEPQTTVDEPDSWRTQSVEFEHKLVARLRHL